MAILLALVFDYTNGFHDASNIIAGVIAARAMTPAQAVLVIAGFEFLGPLLGGTAVASTVGSLVNWAAVPKSEALQIILAGLSAAVFWNLFTWWQELPSSSSHALVGGLIGATLTGIGSAPIAWGFQDLSHGQLIGFSKILLALLISPLLGFALGFAMQRLTMFLLRAAHPRVNSSLRHGQWLTTAALAFSHGANDAQKSMGILTLILLLNGDINDFQVPLWVSLLCATAMTAGALTGGWRIVRTLAFSIYKIRPIHALNSQLTACSVIFGSSLLGAPVSTTHVVASSIMGIGASEHPKLVHWSKAWEILRAWLTTIPGSAIVACYSYLLFDYLLHIAL